MSAQVLNEIIGRLSSPAEETVVIGLERFAKELNRNPSLCALYLQGSPKMTELLDLWDKVASDEKHAMHIPLLDVLAQIFKHWDPATSTANLNIESFYGKYRGTFLSNLRMKQHRVEIICPTLDLLTALNLQDPEGASNRFPFRLAGKWCLNQDVLEDPKKVAKKAGNSRDSAAIRPHFVEFCLSYLEPGIQATIEKAVSKRGFVELLIKNLEYLNEPTQVRLVEVLRDCVFANDMIPRQILVQQVFSNLIVWRSLGRILTETGDLAEKIDSMYRLAFEFVGNYRHKTSPIIAICFSLRPHLFLRHLGILLNACVRFPAVVHVYVLEVTKDLHFNLAYLAAWIAKANVITRILASPLPVPQIRQMVVMASTVVQIPVVNSEAIGVSGPTKATATTTTKTVVNFRRVLDVVCPKTMAAIFSTALMTFSNRIVLLQALQMLTAIFERSERLADLLGITAKAVTMSGIEQWNAFCAAVEERVPHFDVMLRMAAKCGFDKTSLCPSSATTMRSAGAQRWTLEAREFVLSRFLVTVGYYQRLTRYATHVSVEAILPPAYLLRRREAHEPLPLPLQVIIFSCYVRCPVSLKVWLTTNTVADAVLETDENDGKAVEKGHFGQAQLPKPTRNTLLVQLTLLCADLFNQQRTQNETLAEQAFCLSFELLFRVFGELIFPKPSRAHRLQMLLFVLDLAEQAQQGGGDEREDQRTVLAIGLSVALMNMMLIAKMGNTPFLVEQKGQHSTSNAGGSSSSSNKTNQACDEESLLGYCKKRTLPMSPENAAKPGMRELAAAFLERVDKKWKSILMMIQSPPSPVDGLTPEESSRILSLEQKIVEAVVEVTCRPPLGHLFSGHQGEEGAANSAEEETNVVANIMSLFRQRPQTGGILDATTGGRGFAFVRLPGSSSAVRRTPGATTTITRPQVDESGRWSVGGSSEKDAVIPQWNISALLGQLQNFVNEIAQSAPPTPSLAMPEKGELGANAVSWLATNVAQLLKAVTSDHANAATFRTLLCAPGQGALVLGWALRFHPNRSPKTTLLLHLVFCLALRLPSGPQLDSFLEALAFPLLTLYHGTLTGSDPLIFQLLSMHSAGGPQFLFHQRLYLIGTQALVGENHFTEPSKPLTLMKVQKALFGIHLNGWALQVSFSHFPLDIPFRVPSKLPADLSPTRYIADHIRPFLHQPSVFDSANVQAQGQGMVYDPRYILPAFYALMQATYQAAMEALKSKKKSKEQNERWGHSPIHFGRLFNAGIVAYVVRCLSCADPALRQLAAAGLGLLCTLLDAKTKVTRSYPVQHFVLTWLKNGLFNSANGEIERVPSIHTALLAEMLRAQQRQHARLFGALFYALVVRTPQCNFHELPLLGELSGSHKLFEIEGPKSCLNSKLFLITLISLGLRTPDDFKLCARMHIFEAILVQFHHTAIQGPFLATPLYRDQIALRRAVMTFLGRCLGHSEGLKPVVTHLITLTHVIGFLTDILWANVPRLAKTQNKFLGWAETRDALRLLQAVFAWLRDNLAGTNLLRLRYSHATTFNTVQSLLALTHVPFLLLNIITTLETIYQCYSSSTSIFLTSASSAADFDATVKKLSFPLIPAVDLFQLSTVFHPYVQSWQQNEHPDPDVEILLSAFRSVVMACVSDHRALALTVPEMEDLLKRLPGPGSKPGSLNPIKPPVARPKLTSVAEVRVGDDHSKEQQQELAEPEQPPKKKKKKKRAAQIE